MAKDRNSSRVGRQSSRSRRRDEHAPILSDDEDRVNRRAGGVLLLVALFHFECRGRGQTNVNDRAWRERRGIPISGHHDRRATGSTGCAADNGAFPATEDRAENRATDGSSTNLASAFGRR